MSDAAKSKARQKWPIEKPKLDNARHLRGIFFIEPDEEEFKRTMKNARAKLEIPMPAALPCKTQKKRQEASRIIGKHKTKYACIVDADESIDAQMNFCALYPCLFDHLFLVSDFRQLPCRYFLKFSHYFSTAAFAASIFFACGLGIELRTKLKWLSEFIPFAAM